MLVLHILHQQYNRFENLKKDLHELPQNEGSSIVTSGWGKIRFRMKRVEKKLDNSNLIDKITST